MVTNRRRTDGRGRTLAAATAAVLLGVGVAATPVVAASDDEERPAASRPTRDTNAVISENGETEVITDPNDPRVTELMGRLEQQLSGLDNSLNGIVAHLWGLGGGAETAHSDQPLIPDLTTLLDEVVQDTGRPAWPADHGGGAGQAGPETWDGDPSGPASTGGTSGDCPGGEADDPLASTLPGSSGSSGSSGPLGSAGLVPAGTEDGVPGPDALSSGPAGTGSEVDEWCDLTPEEQAMVLEILTSVFDSLGMSELLPRLAEQPPAAPAGR
ncbi:hypothetical protein [Allostreptomyces psammosilenae]|uniref:Secreted protein n=1 Tax=Allostreptomyces psammosilenae TaxID=1892865 RepID=A0A852ZX54_9ACTN|nr:hypothetical protein [Allostreptomyces psammosilenae]NYI06287.1 hypothetical protein [Allostreptomyces psammosilenae]